MSDEKITKIYVQVRDGEMDSDVARVALTHTGAVPTFLPVHLTVRATKSGEKPGWSQTNNFKLSRNEIVFRLPRYVDK